MSQSKEYYEIPSSSTSEDPLLEEEKDVNVDYNRPKSKARRLCRRMIWPAIIHLGIMAIYVSALTYGFNVWEKGRYCHKPLVYSPARDAVEYEKIDYNGGLYRENIYKGPPSPEGDAAWAELVAPTNLRVDKHTLKMINRTALELSDHSGYHGGLSVHHHLHCLKYIRQALHPEYYDQELTKDPDLMEHVYHCIDDVRQALMCNPDLTVYTHVWIEGYRKPWPNFDVEHECVNWDKLNGWAIESSFDMFKPNLLIHPDLGLSFPIVNGKMQISALSSDTVFVKPGELEADFHDPEAHSAHGGHGH